MHEAHYEKAGWISHLTVAEQEKLCVPCLRPIVRAFAANVARLESAWLLLPYLVDTTMNSTAITVEVMHTKLGTYDIEDPRQHDPATSAILKAEFFRLSMAHAVKTFDDDSLVRGLQRLDYILANSPQGFIKTGIETALASQVLNAWTAVESFLKDLWEAALNHGPKKWVSKVIDSGPMKALKDNEKSISASTLQRYKYDLRKSMGTVLLSKIGFDTIDEILSAYISIFGKIIESIYPCDVLTNVRALEAIRHLFAHRGGIVDTKFLGKVKALPQLSGLNVGRQLVIAGEVAGQLTHDAIDLSLGLLGFVNLQLKTDNEIGEPEWNI